MRQRSSGRSDGRRKSSRKKQSEPHPDTTSSSFEHSNSVTPIARGGVACPFPWKLHEMLDFVQSKNMESIVSWDAKGTAFSVNDVPTFVKTILPQFFSQTKYASFQRQLNLYGFSRMRRNGYSAYYHDCFIRGKPDLVRFMVRCKVKGTGRKRMEQGPTPFLAERLFAAPAPITPRPEDAASSVDVSSVGEGSFANTQDDDEFFPDEVTDKNAQDGDLVFFEGTPFHFLEPSSLESPTNVVSAMPIPLLCSSSQPNLPKTRLAPRSRANSAFSPEFHNFVL